jgi:hypothetical protein
VELSEDEEEAIAGRKEIYRKGKVKRIKLGGTAQNE